MSQFRDQLLNDVVYVLNQASRNEKYIAKLEAALLDCVTSIESHNAKPFATKLFEQEARFGREVLLKPKLKDVRDE